jgi:predicted molibdopterin-dependent oxidoreductase YjgC
MNRNVTIDGKIVELTPFDNNVIEMTSRANIKIPAPCYRTKRIKGCCSVCVVEIDGEQHFACSTVPQHSMNIIVDREDLKAIRKQRLLEYKESIKGGKNKSED